MWPLPPLPSKWENHPAPTPAGRRPAQRMKMGRRGSQPSHPAQVGGRARYMLVLCFYHLESASLPVTFFPPTVYFVCHSFGGAGPFWRRGKTLEATRHFRYAEDENQLHDFVSRRRKRRPLIERCVVLIVRRTDPYRPCNCIRVTESQSHRINGTTLGSKLYVVLYLANCTIPQVHPASEGRRRRYLVAPW